MLDLDDEGELIKGHHEVNLTPADLNIGKYDGARMGLLKKFSNMEERSPLGSSPI